MNIITSMLCMLSIGGVIGFAINDLSYCYPPPLHHNHNLLHRYTSCAIGIATHTALHSSANDIDLRAEQDINLSSAQTAPAPAIPIQLLSLKDRDGVDKLVQERSEARWNGDYTKADELREIIDKTRVGIPWSRILEHINIKDGDNLREFAAQQQKQQPDVDLEYKVLVTDIPRSEGGGSKWDLEPIENPLLDTTTNTNAQKEDNVLQLAHAALGMAVSASERGANVDQHLMKELITRAEDRLNYIKQRKSMSVFFPGAAAAAGELHGRKAADAILWFALAGVGSKKENNDDNVNMNNMHMHMYNDLVDIATEELLRFGMNSSCRAKDVLHIVERVAMAGIVGEHSKELYRVAADCLEVKMGRSSGSGSSDKQQQSEKNADTIDEEEEEGGIDYGKIIRSLRGSTFGLHSDRSLLGLWRFSTRQRKQRAFFRNAALHFDGKFGEGNNNGSTTAPDHDVRNQYYDWSAMFEDPSRPLVVDVGCGMGVSLLGLASLPPNNDDDQSSTTTASSDIQVDWRECNFIGVDLSGLTIRYAQGVCERWSLKEDNLNFVVDSAEECLKRISESYPGKISLVMLQFPTPYRFQGNAEEDEDDGCDSRDDLTPSVAHKGYNSQLPEGSASNDFMVTEKLLTLVNEVLSKHNGQLLLQSNCEDVAVHMRNVAVTKVGFQSVTSSNPVRSLDAVTQRAQNWVAIGGERAIGDCWSAEPLLPPGGRTETEVACLLDNKPVHRCLLKVS